MVGSKLLLHVKRLPMFKSRATIRQVQPFCFYHRTFALQFLLMCSIGLWISRIPSPQLYLLAYLAALTLWFQLKSSITTSHQKGDMRKGALPEEWLEDFEMKCDSATKFARLVPKQFLDLAWFLAMGFYVHRGTALQGNQ